MSFLKSFFLLNFTFLSFCNYSNGSDKDDYVSALLGLSNPIRYDFKEEVNESDVQTLLDLANSNPVNLPSISIIPVASFTEALPYFNRLEPKDFLFSDIDDTLVNSEYDLMEPDISKTLKRLKDRRVFVLALTTALHPNEKRETKLAKRKIKFSDNFKGLKDEHKGFGSLTKGILSSVRGGKGETLVKFLEEAFPNKRLSSRKKDIRPREICVIDDQIGNLLDIKNSLESFLPQSSFTDIKEVVLLHYVPCEQVCNSRSYYHN